MDPGTGKRNDNYMELLLSEESFKKNIDNYYYDGTIDFDTSLTRHGKKDSDDIVRYDLYVLKTP